MIGILIGVLSLVLIGTGLFYFVATTGFGMIEGRRLRHPRGPGRPRRRDDDGPTSIDARPEAVYFLVPCLNEEGVIGSTVTRLLADAEARVVVVDDASDDRTAQVVRSVGGDRTLLISRRLPLARKGKGMALNAGLPAIIADSKARGLHPSRVLVCVMDADGYLSEGALGHVLPLFDDPKVGGAQLGVRISNRDVNMLTTMQDFEFWGLAATAQLGRVRLGTVSLGGNGQFTRLEALCSLGDRPWSTALTEDLDLALRLMEGGWRLTTTPLASVNQQAVLTLPALIRQRTRWFQGHMACFGHLRKLWGSSSLSNLALMEVSAYLLIPWVFILPWSILFHLGLWELLGRLASAPNAAAGGSDIVVRIITLIAWYLLGFGPSLFGGYLYYRQDQSGGRLRAIALGHVLILCNYVAFVSCWLAAFRSLRGIRGWEKTVRRSEGALEYLIPSTLVAASGRVIGRLRRQPDARVTPSRPSPPAAPVMARGAASSLPIMLRFETSEGGPVAPLPALAVAPPVSIVTTATSAPTTTTSVPMAATAARPTTATATTPAGATSATAATSVTVRAIVSRPEVSAGIETSGMTTVRARVTRGPVREHPASGGSRPGPLGNSPSGPMPGTPPGASQISSPTPLVTGRLRVGPRRANSNNSDNSDRSVSEIGSRFLIDEAVFSMVPTLEEESA